MNNPLLTSLTPHQLELLKKYSEAVESAPSWLGLTAAGDRTRFWERHIMDTLAMIQALPEEWKKTTKKIIDVGTGNGVPGLVIAIAIPNWQVYLNDSDNKKVGFLDKFCILNEIKNVGFLSDRSEKLCHTELRDSYDIAFSRALGRLPTALELTSPFVKVGGGVIVSHGTSWRQEVDESKKAMKSLMINLVNSRPYSKDEKGVILHFNKEGHTPKEYPRRVGVPAKRPL